MSNSVRPHRWQPTRLPRPWDSPGKNTGVRWHFFLQFMKVKSESEVTQSCLTLSDPKTSVSLLIFCFDDLSIGVSGVLKSPTIIVLLSFSPFSLLALVLCMELLLCWVHRYLQLLCLPLGLIP